MQTFQQPLTPEEEQHYLKLCQEGNLEARNYLVERNLRLVAHIVKKYGNYDRDIEDLLSIGTEKEGNEISFFDIIENQGEDIVATLISRHQVTVLYQELSNSLSERERMIIIMRYGLYGNACLTQHDVAIMLGISRSYVSRIEKRALSKLKHALE